MIVRPKMPEVDRSGPVPNVPPWAAQALAAVTGVQVMVTTPEVLSVLTASVDARSLTVQGEPCSSATVGWAHFRAPLPSMLVTNWPVGQSWPEVAKSAPL